MSRRSVGTGPGASRARGSASRWRAARARARHRGRGCLDARCARRGGRERAPGDRRAPRGGVFVPGPAAVKPEDVAAAGRSVSVTAPSGTAPCSRRTARSFRPTTTRGTRPGRRSTHGSRPSSGRSTRSSRSTSAPPTPSGGWLIVRFSAARGHRPRRDRADRARVVPDALVALDVRDGAREAELAVARRRRRRGPARRLPRPLAATSTHGT